MSVTQKQALRLLTGNFAFSVLGFSMMLTRLKNLYARNATEETLTKCVGEINAFLAAYGAIMGSDYNAISKL